MFFLFSGPQKTQAFRSFLSIFKILIKLLDVPQKFQMWEISAEKNQNTFQKHKIKLSGVFQVFFLLIPNTQ